MPNSDVELLSYTSFRGIPAESSLGRAQSELNLYECANTSTNPSFSMLKLSKTRITVGDSITVYWDIREACGASDWIGLFDLDGPTSLSNYLDAKQRGVTGARRGAIKWVISRSITFNEVETKCIFKYISAGTDTVKAISPTLFVHNPLAEIPGSGRTRRQSNVTQDALLEFSVSDIRAGGLKKNIFGKPSPYVKLSIIPSRRHFRSWKHHHGQIAKTSSKPNTIFPDWESEEFVFLGGHDDMFEIEVRNKFSGTRPTFSRFLGKLCIPLSDVFDNHHLHRPDIVTKPLLKRTPTDRIAGTIQFSLTVMSSVTNRAGEQQGSANQENVSPDLASTPQRGASTTCVVLTNPALRSSAPNILRQLDLNLDSTQDSSDTPSPLSPFGEREAQSDDVVPRRRAYSRDSRPYSEMYTSDFVPLDGVGATPRSRQYRTDTMSSVQSELPRLEDLEHMEEIAEDHGHRLEVRLAVDGPSDNLQQAQTVEEGASVDAREEEPAEDQEPESVELTEPVEAVAEVDDTQDNESADALEEQSPEDGISQMEVLSDGENVADLESGTTEDDTHPVDLANSSFVMRASVGSIELTEDSPLRIIEESEIAREEEVAFSPRSLDLDEESDEEEQMDTGEVLDDSIDGLSDEISPMDDTTSVTPSIISADSWSNGPNPSITASQSTESLPLHAPPVEQEASAMSSVSSDELRTADDHEDEIVQAISPIIANVHGVQVFRTDENGDESSSSLLESAPGTSVDDESFEDRTISPNMDSPFPEASSVIIDVENDDIRRDVRSASSPVEVTVIPSTSSKQARRRQLSLIETVDRIVTSESVGDRRPNMRRRASEGIPVRESSTERVEIISAEVINSSPRSSSSEGTTPSPTVRHEGSSPRAALTSSLIAFSLESSEPVSLNTTPIEGASFELLVDQQSEPIEPIPRTTTGRLDVRPASMRSNRVDRMLEERVRPSRPARRSKQLTRSTSDPRGALSSRHPERPDRPRRRRTETEPRSKVQSARAVRTAVAAVVAVSQDVTNSETSTFTNELLSRTEHSVSRSDTSAVQRDSLSDPVVVALPMTPVTTGSPIVVASALPEASSSVTPLPSPSLDSDVEDRDLGSGDLETVVAVPVAVTSAESTSSSLVNGEDERTVVAAALPMSPVHNSSTSVTPLPSPTSPLASPRHGETSAAHRERSSRPSAPIPTMDYQDESSSNAIGSSDPTESLDRVHGREQPSASLINVTSVPVTRGGDDASLSSVDATRNINRQLRDYVRNAHASHPVRDDVTTYEEQMRAGPRGGQLPSTALRINDDVVTYEEGMRVEHRNRARIEHTDDDVVTYEEQMRAAHSVQGLRPEHRGEAPSYEGESRTRARNDDMARPERVETRIRPERNDEDLRAQSRTPDRGGEGSPMLAGRRNRAQQPEHHAEGPVRRRSTRTQRGDRQNPQPVHLQIQDQRLARANRELNEEPLPPNWERGVDSHGRVYYIDHANRTTTWNRPTRGIPENESNMNDINTHWQSLDRRYQSFRRTLRGRNRHGRPPLHPSARSNQSEDGTSSAGSSPTVSRAGPAPLAGQASGVAASTPAPDSLPPTRSHNPAPGPSDGSPRSRPASGGTSVSRNRSMAACNSARSAALMNSPAVKFITRADFIDYIKNSGVAGQYYFQSQMLKLIISKIRSDPSQFERYRHQVELVRFLNQFADPQIELSPGWDKKVDQNGRLYFIDHNTRTTTFIDPRLPLSGTDRRSRAGTETELQPTRRTRAPPPRPPPPRGHSRAGSTGGSSTTLTYNQQVIGFLSQPNIDELIARKQPQFGRSPALKAAVRRAQTEGERALERLSNNIDFVLLLSMFEDEIMSFVPPEMSQASTSSGPPTPSSSQPTSPVRAPTNRLSAIPADLKEKGAAARETASPSPAPYRRDFEAKVRSFHRQLYHKGYGQGPNKIKMVIRRDRLLEDAYDQIMKETARSLQRNRMEIQFAGEEGLDYGGPAREFFFLISRQIFNPYYGLFEYSANDTYTVQVSPVSLYVDNSHEWFRFCGRILGLVIIHQHLLDAFFTRTFYKALLRSSCDLSDVEALDALFHQSMTWVIENEIEDVLDLTFTVTEEIFGQVTERELIPGGKDIIVTDDNKGDYVAEMVKWRVERGVSEQMESIVRGFNEVIDPALVNIFDARELELVISGTADIDIKDWRRNTEYRSGYHDNHKVVKWFWKAVSSFDNEQRLRLLQFVTGTSSIPYEGFAALRGSTGPRKFSIERWGDYTKLPRAHTCFNRLDLPIYRSFDELLEKLTFAVEETGSFAMQ